MGNNVAPAAISDGTDLLKFAPPEVSQGVGVKKRFETAAKSVGKRILKQQLGSGISEQKVISAKSAKQTVRVLTGFVANISRPSYQTVLGGNQSRQFLEIFEGKS